MTPSAVTEQQLKAIKTSHPLLGRLTAQDDLLWLNPKFSVTGACDNTLTNADMLDASERLARFAPYIEMVFPETKSANGIIESPLRVVADFQRSLLERAMPLQPSSLLDSGKLLIKCDSHLPIAGSIKARGGIYEILFLAEKLSLAEGLLTVQDNYQVLATSKFSQFFARHSVVVGSTGNLGLSIGIISAKLGFNVTVHMSADARAWKKELLRSKGVNVVEHLGDYGKAVEQGRKEADQTERCHFVDDENSKQLFLGYSVAALRLQAQLIEQEIIVDGDHPLFVYLPCGVGGAPGGITFGLKQVFGQHVHCFFAEPTAAPCMLLGMYSGLHDEISVQDIGLDGLTCADGLAVGRASGFVGKFIEPVLSGVFTVQDNDLYRLLAMLKDSENLKLEPSALAGAVGMNYLLNDEQGLAYLADNQLTAKHMHNATHIAWGTGGSMVPDEEYAAYYEKGCG